MYLFSALAVVLLPPSCAFGGDPSLKLHLSFDQDFSSGQVVDLSGHGNHGWQFNPTNWITPTNGVFGSVAAQFTTNFTMGDNSGHIYPASQYIGVTNLDGIEYLTNATISFWVQFDTNYAITIRLLSAGYPSIYALGGQSVASNSWSIGRNYRSYLSFAVFPADSQGRDVVNWPIDVIRPGGSTPNLGTTKMRLHTVTVDCVADRVIAYYDGQPFMTNSIGLPWIRIYGYPIKWLCIGANKHIGTPQWGDDLWPNDGYHQGKLDDIRIYDRTLSAAEVLALYHGAGTPAASSFVALQPDGPDSVQFTWDSRTNVQYQVEYRTNLTSGPWRSLLPPVAGNGGTNSITDSISGHATKFYRVRPLP